jgi:hypothetical protein
MTLRKKMKIMKKNDKLNKGTDENEEMDGRRSA